MKLSLSRFTQVGLLSFLIISIGCSSNKINPNVTPEERYDIAMKLLEKGSYMKARTQFQILTLNYPGTKIADKSQFQLAESHYGSKEYILAGSEYEKMVRNYPNSELVDDAQYKLGMCFYELSPNYQLDQKYTINAINEFQKFLEEYPTSELKDEVTSKLEESRMKLARKEFSNAEQYRRLGYYTPAVIYYDIVLQNYYDSPFAEEAMFRKGEVQMKLKKWEEAQKIFEVFVVKYRDGRFTPAAKDHLRDIPQKMAEQVVKGK